MNLGKEMVFTLFTNNPDLALQADLAGVDRIGLDFEVLGKANRQDRNKSWISDHRFEELSAISAQLTKASLFARTNPMHNGLKSEIDRYIEAGVKVLMMPMVKSAEDVGKFLEYVDDRAKVSLLVETPAGAMRLHEIVQIKGIGDIHIGLNDMYLGMGLANHFEVLVSDFMEALAGTSIDAGLPFGFGGVARKVDESLPVSSELIYAQYARLNATRALISRVFTQGISHADMIKELAVCRSALSRWGNESPEKIHKAKLELRQTVASLREKS